MVRRWSIPPALLLLAATPHAVFAQSAAPRIDSGDTAWVLTCTALVLMMTAPGLALFYGGMVQKKNALTTIMHSFICMALVSIQWVLLGYSLAFGPDKGGVIGGLEWAGLRGVGLDPVSYAPTVPHQAFMMFQLMFAIITPALITGAFAERMKFSAYLAFIVLWSLLVYCPVAHWLWNPGGWLFKRGALDFAGGTVVHLNAGMASLVCALVLGRRRGFPETPMPPHNLTMTVAGACMLWVGWFGFNAGSALAADGSAGMAMLVTHIGAATGAFAWTVCEWVRFGKPSVLGIVTGMVAGLGTITPASGFVGPLGALVIGAAAGIGCFFATNFMKRTMHVDDSLDVHPVHGLGGIIGTILTGVFAAAALGGVGYPENVTMGDQVLVQLTGVLATAVWCGVVTWILLKISNAMVGLRVTAEDETEGLDTVLHNEKGYNL